MLASNVVFHSTEIAGKNEISAARITTFQPGLAFPLRFRIC
jgi:hypothetical protein